MLLPDIATILPDVRSSPFHGNRAEDIELDAVSFNDLEIIIHHDQA